MKKITLMLVLIFAIQLSYSQAGEWEEYGPTGIKANNICFFDNINAFAIICVDSGMFVVNYSSQDWEFYSYGNMPVVEAVSPSYGSDSLIIIMSDGSWSDGIWSFDLETGQFNVIDWYYKPNFIVTNFEKDRFYVGYESGLLFSEDGNIWNEVTFFNNMTCLDLEIDGDKMVVATAAGTNNTYLSEDNGLNWVQLSGDNITQLSGNPYSNNLIYGISKGEAENCGLFQLDFESQEWENIFYSSHLNTIGTDNSGTQFIGWHDGISPQEGIAKYTNSGLTFYNDELPNLNINAISHPDIVGATLVYCCTDYGVYRNILSVGIKENNKITLNIAPNPVSNNQNITISNPENIKVISAQVYSVSGEFILKKDFNQQSELYEINLGNSQTGVYFINIRTSEGDVVRKLIKR